MVWPISKTTHCQYSHHELYRTLRNNFSSRSTSSALPAKNMLLGICAAQEYGICSSIKISRPSQYFSGSTVQSLPHWIDLRGPRKKTGRTESKAIREEGWKSKKGLAVYMGKKTKYRTMTNVCHYAVWALSNLIIFVAQKKYLGQDPQGKVEFRSQAEVSFSLSRVVSLCMYVTGANISTTN